MRPRLIILLIILCVLLCACSSDDGTDADPTDQISTTEMIDLMSDNALLSKAPKFNNGTGSIVQDGELSAIIEFSGVTDEEFANYKTECEDAGFILDGFISDQYYIATDLDGYVVTVVYSQGKMMIEIDAPPDT